MCSSDYQDKQDDENHKVTLGADVSICNTTTDLVFSHSLQLLISLFKCERLPWGRNGVRNYQSFCSVCKFVFLIKSF